MFSMFSKSILYECYNDKLFISPGSVREIVILRYLAHHTNRVCRITHIDSAEILVESGGKDLTQIYHSTQLQLKDIYEIATRALIALAEIHEAGIIHADIKPDNIVAQSRPWDVKICDFDMAVINTGSNTGNAYTAWYRSPEAIAGTFSEKSDIWAMGCVIAELFTKLPIFITEDVSDQALLNNILRRFRSTRKMFVKPRDLNPDLITDPFMNKLILQMLSLDPANRPSARECIHYITGIVVKPPIQKSCLPAIMAEFQALQVEKTLPPILPGLGLLMLTGNDDKFYESMESMSAEK